MLAIARFIWTARFIKWAVLRICGKKKTPYPNPGTYLDTANPFNY